MLDNVGINNITFGSSSARDKREGGGERGREGPRGLLADPLAR